MLATLVGVSAAALLLIVLAVLVWTYSDVVQQRPQPHPALVGSYASLLEDPLVIRRVAKSTSLVYLKDGDHLFAERMVADLQPGDLFTWDDDTTLYEVESTDFDADRTLDEDEIETGVVYVTLAYFDPAVAV